MSKHIHNSNEIEYQRGLFEGDDISNLSGPFDPNDIDVDISVINLGSLLEQLEFEEIKLDPEFQRSSDVWDKKKKSRLIESVLLGLPIPSFYFSEDPESNQLQIVDGLQRLCAFKDFCVEKKLALQDLQFLKEFEGKKYLDLDRTQVRRIKSLKITVNTLRRQTPPTVKYVIFQRVNTAGVPLTSQEMRNALYQKKAIKLLHDMANLDSFKLATGGKVTSKRMADCDFTNRFVAFYLMADSYKGELDSFLGDALAYVNTLSASEIDDILNVFDNTMSLCYRLLGPNSFRRPRNSYTYFKINKAIFEALSVTLAKLSCEEIRQIEDRSSEFCEKMQNLYKSDMFVKSVTSGTAKMPQVLSRFQSISQVINSIVSHD